MSSKLSSLFNASTCPHFEAYALKIWSSCAQNFELKISSFFVSPRLDFYVQYILAYPALDYPAPRLTGRVQQANTFYIIM